MTEQTLQCGRFQLDLSSSKIMGVLNCTPDSFSDGGKFVQIDAALTHAETMIAEGADIIDIGAESTRPGAAPISAEEEIARLTPIASALVADGRKPISIDTRHTKTMQAMLDLGVDMINDISALEAEGAIDAVKQSSVAICLMHMRGIPQTMQNHTLYDNVVTEVAQYLARRAELCREAGIDANRIVLDPGFGFAKTPEQNMALIAQIKAFLNLSYPVLIGVSRKSTIGHYLDNRAVEDRVIGSVVLAALGAYKGAQIVRVHDIKATKDALLMVEALKNAKAM